MKKRIGYRSVSVEQFDVAGVLAELSGTESVVLAIDVAKTKFVAAVMGGPKRVLGIVRWEHPREIGALLGLVERLGAGGRAVVAVMEPTGTYGDALRYQLEALGVAVHRVGCKQVHDAAELHDGVPSKHDAKDATVIGWLYYEGKSRPWPRRSAEQRALRGLVTERELFSRPMEHTLGMLEALLARHFPELGRRFDVSRARSIWAVLEAFPSPAQIASAADAVRALLQKASRGKFSAAKADELIALAGSTSGEPMDDSSKRLLKRVIAEIRRCQSELDKVDAEIETAVDKPHLAAMREVIGPVTTAVVLAHLGSPADYGSAAAFQKACGLNLKERSSGQHSGRLHLTKRGPGLVRKYLYLAALRLIMREPIVRAWYLARGAHRAGAKQSAVVAVQRKLALALVHVARGEPFDPSRLFDARRLGLAVVPSTDSLSIEVIP